MGFLYNGQFQLNDHPVSCFTAFYSVLPSNGDFCF